MYLGQFEKTYKAADDKTIFARAANTPNATRQAEAVGVAPTVVAATSNVAVGIESSPTVTAQAPAEVTATDASAERIAELEQQLAEAKAKTSHQSGRVKRLLGVLRGNKRTIARLERELSAHTADDKLTVSDILEDTNARSDSMSL